MVSIFNSRWWLFAALLITVAAVVNVSAQQRPRDERSDEGSSGTITGIVVNESGQPLANAAINVRAVNAPQSRTATTSMDGTFVVRGLDPSLFFVTASLPAYVTKLGQPDSLPAFHRVGDKLRLELNKGGVVTGTVTASNGDPVVGMRVRAYLIRYEDGRRARVAGIAGDRTTDDRGVYRIYGLSPGVYVIAAGGPSSGYFSMSFLDGEGQTFAPSSTRDTASEVTVRSGDETTNVDIKFRPDPGHQVTGRINGPSAPGQMSRNTVILTPVGTAMPSINGFQLPGSTSFSFSGVSDGTYDVTAQTVFPPQTDVFVSDPYRITVKGSDVTGIELVPKALASIAGKLVLEASKDPECKGKRRPILTETLVVPLRNADKSVDDEVRSVTRTANPTVADADGVFRFRNVPSNRYGFDVRLYAKYWYLQSITLPAPTKATAGERSSATTRSIDVARNWLNVKAGDQISGLSITLAEGAASLKGSVSTDGSEALPPQLYLHLVPAERENADDVLRFFVTAINEDRTFALTNLPPGRYWALVVASPKGQSTTVSRLRQPEEAETRAKLRRDAEAARVEVELKPCQNVDGYALKTSNR